MPRGIKFIRQKDSMDCGVTALAMATQWFGREYPREVLEASCRPTTQGVNLRAIAETADSIGLKSRAMRMGIDDLAALTTPCILHWDQTHFVLLYGYRRGKFRIADPAKGLVKYTPGELAAHWISTSSRGVDRGIGLVLERTPSFGQGAVGGRGEKRSLRFLYRYLRQYRRYFAQIMLGLLLGSLLQLAMPFLTQWIVDFGINRRDIGFVWLVLLGELMIVAGRTATDFVRRWLLLHISMRVNISLVSDFFIKLLRLPMAFFDTKLLGDLLQRIGDHSRVQSFLTTQALGIMFTALSFIVFGIVLLVYDPTVFLVFLAGSAAYGLWIAAFLRRRKVIDYELFERQALNQNRTYQFVTSMQEIKLQDCEAAVYRNPDFILLDEATNALDARNERAIVENLAEFYRGRTVVVVAHRLSTVRDADRIIVLDGGRVAETGTHASLIALRGVYHTLVKNQLELGN